jgi:hypothetical protein
MTILTYCKGLPTPINELNEVGKTELEMFLSEYAEIFRAASIETVQHLQSLTGKDVPRTHPRQPRVNVKHFNKSAWNRQLQKAYGISKRHASGIIASAEGKLDSAKECRKNYIKQLEQKLKSAKKWLKSATKKISLVDDGLNKPTFFLGS